MSRSRIIAVLGGFLESEWLDLWQRQQEFSSSLMQRGHVLYVERAAGGRITPRRVLSRLVKVARGATAGRKHTTDVPAPEFVKWVQLPASGSRAVSMNAQRVVAAIQSRCRALGAEKPDLVYATAPTEVWAEVLRLLEVPYWYDMPERFLESATYETVDRAAMRWMVEHAALVTVDTQVGLSDWSDLRDDIVVVEHGAKSRAVEPDWSCERTHLYYVGSRNPALDTRFLDLASEVIGESVRVIGEGRPSDYGAHASVLGWTAGDEIPYVLSDAVAGLVPYVLDEFTAGVSPTKVYDYFLGGAPVIATALPSLEGRRGVITSEATAASIEAAIEQARAMTLEERRGLREFALANRWERRFELIERELRARGVLLDE
jgi:hypothetical protein